VRNTDAGLAEQRRELETWECDCGRKGREVENSVTRNVHVNTSRLVPLHTGYAQHLSQCSSDVGHAYPLIVSEKAGNLDKKFLIFKNSRQTKISL